MHTAVSATPLLAGRKEPVDSLVVHAGNLLLGGPHSSLVAYKLHETAQADDVASSSASAASLQSAALARTPAWSVRLSKSPRSIEQIKVIREANIFVTLSDGTVALHDIAGIQEAGKGARSGPNGETASLAALPIAPSEATTSLIQSKGALTFAIDTSIQRMSSKEESSSGSSVRHGPGGGGAGYRNRAGQSTVGRAYRPSDVTLGRKMGSNTAMRGGQRPVSASLRGMEDLQRDKEERQRWTTMNARMATNYEGEETSEGVMSIVSTLAIGCRRKLLIFRWVDGSFWDTKEITLPHSPRTLAFPSPTTLFMGYTASEYAILTVPMAASSSVSDLLGERGATPVAMSVPSSSIAGTRVDLYEWSLKVLNIPISGRFDETENDAASHQSPSHTANPNATTSGMAAMAGAAFGGLGGYIGMGARNKPHVIQIDGGEVLVCRDTIGVFLSEEGKPTRRDGIEWPAIPEEVGYIKPYVFSVLPASTSSSKQAPSFPILQVRSASTLVPVQTLPFPPLSDYQPSSKAANAPPLTALSQLAGNTPIVRLLTASAGGKPPLYITVTPSERGAMERDGSSIWCLEMKSWGKQIDELVEAEEFQEALALLNSIDDVLLDDKEERRAYIEALYAVSLFANGKFDDAIEHFIELETNPARVIALFPVEISGPLAKDRSQWVEMFGGAKKSKLARITKKDDSDTVSIQSTQSRKGSSMAIPRDRGRLANLWGRRPQSMIGGEGVSPSTSLASSPVTGAAISKVKSSGVKEEEGRSAKSSKGSSDGPKAEDDSTQGEASSVTIPPAPVGPPPKLMLSEEEKRSTDALGRFLADRRRIFKPILELQASSHSVTQSQIKRDPEWLLALPSKPLSTMDLDQLTAVAQTVDTALFKTFLATKPALVGPLCRVENWCEVEQVEELLMKAGKYSELIALYGGKEMHDKALQLLRRFGDEEDDIEEKLGPTIRYLQNLGPDHISLILRTAHWVMGVDSEMGMEIFCADTGKVSSLPRFEIVADLEQFNEDLCISFLIHLIQNTGEGDPSLHEKLAFLLLRRAEGQSGEERASTVSQLLHHLESSHQYRAERVLNRLPTDDQDWFEARALLLGRLGQHEAALGIYINRLNDTSKAEEYCRKIQQQDESSPVFLTLLRIYLRPKFEGRLQGKVELEAALGLISRHGSRIDSVATLDLLPPLVKLQAVEQFTSKALRQVEGKRNEQLILNQVAKERALQVDESCLRLHSRRVKVTDTRTCPRCMKRLGNSVIAVTAHGAVMHYGCANFDG
jgi:tetratricopeptide (TPR) repeat protein